MNPNYRITYKRPGPLAQAISLVVGILVLGLAFVFGVFILAVLAGLITIAAIAISLRVWRLRKKYEQAVRQGREPGDVIEGEFTVVEKKPSDRGDP